MVHTQNLAPKKQVPWCLGPYTQYHGNVIYILNSFVREAKTRGLGGFSNFACDPEKGEFWHQKRIFVPLTFRPTKIDPRPSSSTQSEPKVSQKPLEM